MPRKKLIEVALPLEAINLASAREKSIRHGHPSTLHLWWARRPLAAARAVIFTSLVDDPDDPEAPPAFVAACKALPAEKNTLISDTPRQRLFDFIERLVTWEATTDEAIMETARELIRLSTDGNPPPLLDPFAGGGSIPLEAQRLGLEAHASDLNPVAVMINKAQIEIPPKFANQPPVNPADRAKMMAEGGGWKGVAGLAADVRYYGEWMREKAWERIGHLYPEGPNGETVIAWLWARTVACPNPACRAQMPLVRSFELSKKANNKAWVIPHVDEKTRAIHFEVKTGKGKAPDGTVERTGGTCIACGTPVGFPHIRDEGKAGRMGAQLMAIVTEGRNCRSYYSPDEYHAEVAAQAKPDWSPDHKLPVNPRDFKTPNYGMRTFADLFTPRQLAALTKFSDLVGEARAVIMADALAAGLTGDDIPLREGGRGARAYAEAVSVYLAFAVDRGANYWSSLTVWADFIVQTFGRQALPMIWDYSEANPFSDSTGNWSGAIEWIEKCLTGSIPALTAGFVRQFDATQSMDDHRGIPISTDPPYYDNIGYADLSDFFYVWLRRNMQEIYPEIFGTVLVPKDDELIASPYRFNGNKDKATEFFEKGLVKSFSRMREIIPPEYPLSVYYAFKQQDLVVEETLASTGWETMLNGLVESGFTIVGTWPMRTERDQGLKTGSNVLASSIVLVCRPRPETAAVISRRDFLRELKAELPQKLKDMKTGNIAPVDLAQASIGPGMAVYSRYKAVLEPNGEPLTVRSALALINQALDDYLTEQEGDLDPESRFAVTWFEQNGFKEGDFGSADVLARAKNTAVATVADRGVVTSVAGKVKLISPEDGSYDPGTFNPEKATVWGAVSALVYALNHHGEAGAGAVLAKMGAELAADARDLTYRLYAICEKKGWADLALAYNALVVSWGAAQEGAAKIREQYQQGKLM